MSTYKLNGGSGSSRSCGRGRGRSRGRGSGRGRTLKKIKKGGIFEFSSSKEKYIAKDGDKDIFTCPNVNIKCEIKTIHTITLIQNNQMCVPT